MNSLVIGKLSSFRFSQDSKMPPILLVLPIFFLTIIGNGSLIIVFIQNRRLRRNSSYWFIVSLALADFLIGILTVPFAALLNSGIIPSNRFNCDINMLLNVPLLGSSLLHMVMISFDRHRKVKYPIKYPAYMTTRKAIYSIFGLWSIVIIQIGASFIAPHDFHGKDSNCFFVKWFPRQPIVSTMTNATIATLLASPIILIVILNWKIYQIASHFKKRNHKEIFPKGSNAQESDRIFVIYKNGRIEVIKTDQPNELGLKDSIRKAIIRKKRTLIIGSIILSVAGCWIPSLIFFLIYLFKGVIVTTQLFPWLAYLNSGLNPIHVLIMSHDFRTAFKKLYRLNHKPKDGIVKKLMRDTNRKHRENILKF